MRPWTRRPSIRPSHVENTHWRGPPARTLARPRGATVSVPPISTVPFPDLPRDFDFRTQQQQHKAPLRPLSRSFLGCDDHLTLHPAVRTPPNMFAGESPTCLPSLPRPPTPPSDPSDRQRRLQFPICKPSEKLSIGQPSPRPSVPRTSLAPWRTYAGVSSSVADLDGSLLPSLRQVKDSSRRRRRSLSQRRKPGGTSKASSSPSSLFEQVRSPPHLVPSHASS